MMVNIMKASLSSFLPLANTSPIRTLDGMVCIDSEIAFQTQHSLLWGAGVSGMLLVTLFILRQLVRTLDVMVCMYMQTLKLQSN